MFPRTWSFFWTLLTLLAGTAHADQAAVETDSYLEKTRARWEQLSRQIWELAETSLQEKRSADAIADLLAKEGFKLERGVGLPTAFVATAGSGSPVVAIL